MVLDLRTIVSLFYCGKCSIGTFGEMCCCSAKTLVLPSLYVWTNMYIRSKANTYLQVRTNSLWKQNSIFFSEYNLKFENIVKNMFWKGFRKTTITIKLQGKFFTVVEHKLLTDTHFLNNYNTKVNNNWNEIFKHMCAIDI